MQLRNKVARFDHLDQLSRGDEFDADARLRHEVGVALSGLDKKRVDVVAQPSTAGSRHTQRIDRVGGIAGFLAQFPPAAFGKILSRLGKAGRKLPGEALERGPVLVDDRKMSARCHRDDGEIILLLDRVIELRLARRELDLARDQLKQLAGPAKAAVRDVLQSRSINMPPG